MINSPPWMFAWVLAAHLYPLRKYLFNITLIHFSLMFYFYTPEIVRKRNIDLKWVKSTRLMFRDVVTAWRVSKYGVFSGPYFPAFGLNTESYPVPLRILSKCGKIQTTKVRIWTLFTHYVQMYLTLNKHLFTRQAKTILKLTKTWANDAFLSSLLLTLNKSKVI